jgi:leucyl aminopeptidase
MTLAVTAAEGRLGDAEALAVPVIPGEDGPRVGTGADVVAALGVDTAAALAREEAKGEPGEVTVVPVGRDGVDTVLLAGIGDGSPAALRKAASAVVRRAKSAASLATTMAAGSDATGVQAVAEALGLASYTFTRKSRPKPTKLERATVVVDRGSDARAAVERAAAVVAAVHLARDLANTPSLEKSPEWMAEQARGLAARAGLRITVRDEPALTAEGFGGILAVGRGSSRPPRLVEVTYDPGRARRHVVLVGKGITFDSGGLSLKPLDGMTAMKTDMAGGAAVLGAMSALGAVGARDRVTALVPLAENLPGSDATRPGDVVRHYGGRTSEVLNTDAEGRLVLADALAYATARLRPDVMVDLATLTGAATMGLGKRHGALFATTPGLRDDLVRAGEAAGERLWPMPFVDAYRDGLESAVADQRNVADPGRHFGGGAIVAALFLREFTAGLLWAHLDIAGPARADSDEDEVTKGATGFGVRTLLRWLGS